MPGLPEKLSSDSIIEAIFEIRFDVLSPEPDEVIIGRLTDNEIWRNYRTSRYPISDIPLHIRGRDPNLKYHPMLELANNGKSIIIKVGSNVLSIHYLRPYPGWESFSKLISQGIEHLFLKFGNISVRRLGVRYINAFIPDKHNISSPHDLNLQAAIKGRDLAPPFNINYTLGAKTRFATKVQIATSDMVSGNFPDDFSTFLDIDVFTDIDLPKMDSSDVIHWVNEGHSKEKEAYFDLLPVDIINHLKGDSDE